MTHLIFTYCGQRFLLCGFGELLILAKEKLERSTKEKLERSTFKTDITLIENCPNALFMSNHDGLF